MTTITARVASALAGTLAPQDSDLLRQCELSGQMSAAQAQAHEAAGELEPIGVDVKRIARLWRGPRLWDNVQEL